MEKFKSIWQVRLNFNTVEITGIAPITIEILSNMIKRVMLVSALEYVDIAEKMAECTLVSKQPEYIPTNEKNVIIVAFTIIFKDPAKATEYIARIRR